MSVPILLDTDVLVDFLRDYGKSHGVGLADAIVAATAQIENAELKTLNTKHYPMLKGLQPAYVKACRRNGSLSRPPEQPTAPILDQQALDLDEPLRLVRRTHHRILLVENAGDDQPRLLPLRDRPCNRRRELDQH